MTRHRITATLGLALAVAHVLGVREAVSAQSFVPARLEALKDSDGLDCPKSSRRSPVLFCQAVVSATGTVENVADTHCFGNPGDDRRRSIFLKKKVVDSQFEPATIDGKAVEVFVSFRVLFQETSGSCDVKVVQNLGIQADELGIDYFAPQEILTDGGWMLPIEDAITYREPDWWGLVFSMSVAVDEQGNASDGRVETNNFATEESVRLAVESLEKQRFIPAFVEGVPRAARYEEYLYIAQPAPRRRY